FANSFTLLLLGRACLGLALGGFWAMSASLTMRLVPARTVPKAHTAHLPVSRLGWFAAHAGCSPNLSGRDGSARLLQWSNRYRPK
ncbi:hypothetical protein MJL48_30895, partial [Salmonella enterica subsp. enterica serovar Kentucky]|nr:hypothetical protein [Salmonella enterica subsp. enterica serovar Kentucky]